MFSTRLALLSALFTATSLPAQQQPRTTIEPAAAKPTLTEADFARIEQLGAVALSPDGKWIGYDFRHGVSGPTELRYRAVNGGTESSVALGNTPVFSANGRWLLFTLSPDTSGVRLNAAGRPGG